MIVKMKFLSITGPKADIDRVVNTYLSKYEIHLENALTELSTMQNITPYIQINPYKETLIDDRRLPSFMTRVGLKRRPEQGTKGCSFDCRCKDTTFLGRMQAFTLTFFRRSSVSD